MSSKNLLLYCSVLTAFALCTISRRLKEYFPPVVNPGDSLFLQPPSIVIPIDESGQVSANTSLNNGLLQWIANGTDNELSVELDVTKIGQLTDRYEHLQNCIDNDSPLNDREAQDYLHFAKEIKRLNAWSMLKKTACESFLRDRFMHSYCGMKSKDDYLEMICDIIKIDPSTWEYRKRFNDPEYVLIDFTVHRSNSDREYYFCVPISRQTLSDVGIDSKMNYFDLCMFDIIRFDKKTIKEILVYYYNDFAAEILYRDATIKADDSAKNLLNYSLGLH